MFEHHMFVEVLDAISFEIAIHAGPAREFSTLVADMIRQSGLPGVARITLVADKHSFKHTVTC